MIGKLIGAAALYFGGRKVAEELNNLTGTKGGHLWTGLASGAATLGGIALGAKALVGGAASLSGRLTSRAINQFNPNNPHVNRSYHKKYYRLMKNHKTDPRIRARAAATLRRDLKRANTFKSKYASRSGSIVTNRINSLPGKIGRLSMPIMKMGLSTVGQMAAGVGAGAAAGLAWGIRSADSSRTRGNTGLDASLGGIQSYDPTSGMSARSIGMDPFEDNTAGLVQSLHKLR